MIGCFDRLDNAAAGLTLFACFAVVCAEIIARSFLGLSIGWSEELSRYLIIVSTYFGAAAAVRSREHIRVVLLIALLPPGLRQVVEIFVLLACAVFTGTVAVVGYRWVNDTVSLGLVSAESSLAVPIWVFQLVIPIGFAIMTVRLLAQAWSLVRGNLPDSVSADPMLPDH